MEWIKYPDGEKVTYGYDNGGQVISVTGKKLSRTFNYVTNIKYDKYGQRTYIEYGNNTSTKYSYDPARRWLDTIKTQNKWGEVFQNINYTFDRVGNVLGYENDCLDSVSGNYKTSQTYSYDDLYQLIKVNGETTYNPYQSYVPEFKSTYTQIFEFDSDGLGNMIGKVSSETVNPSVSIGDNLNYSFGYVYDTKYAHRLINVDNRYYKYDSNGNVICEQEGKFDGEEPETYHKINTEAEGVYSTDYGWGLYREKSGGKSSSSSKYRREYTWDERNLLIGSVDPGHTTSYIYGQDGQRSNKYTSSSETLYFNKMWTLHTDSGNAAEGGQFAKNIYLGDTRIVTKLSSPTETTIHEEYFKQYYYHSDHLGSASLITDCDGYEYQRIEYTPYGETWVEKFAPKSEHLANLNFLPYKFTGKEMDEETGLYYYGTRYLDPKYSRWISVDPALGEYVPSAGKGTANDAGNLLGMGGIYNSVNCNLYHYAGNNPVKYVDPDGRFAGDPFNSPEEAAKDWAKTYADDSIHDDREYASVIYSYETDEGTKFSYNIPLQGERKKSIANMKLEKGQRFVSKIHSHGSFDPNHLDDIPSDADYDSMYKDKSNYCNSHIGKEYLVTPDGNLKSFDIYGNVITINSDLPVDPKSIFYSSHNNSYINPQMYHLYNEYVDAQTTTSWDSIYYRKDSYIPYNPGLF